MMVSSMSKHNNKINHPIHLGRHLINKGPKFISHSIIINADNRAYLKPTISSMMFCMVYIVVGLFLMGLAVKIYLSSQQLDLTIFVSGFGVAITTFGMTLIRPFIKKVVFDKKSGQFINNTDRGVKLQNIMSLQINNKIVRSKHGLSYPCYELNMLTKYGRRVNILNHNNLQKLSDDATALSNFLEVDLMDLQREIRIEV